MCFVEKCVQLWYKHVWHAFVVPHRTYGIWTHLCQSPSSRRIAVRSSSQPYYPIRSQNTHYSNPRGCHSTHPDAHCLVRAGHSRVTSPGQLSGCTNISLCSDGTQRTIGNPLLDQPTPALIIPPSRPTEKTATRNYVFVERLEICI
jgi:hypothetical protein